MKKTSSFAAALSLIAAGQIMAADPRTASWLTAYSGDYARVYTNDTMKANGTSITTWANNQLSQSTPVYVGVQQILSSSNFVYIRTTGLGSHIMGPWWNDASKTTAFVNLPVNQKLIYRFPINAVVPATHVYTQLGEIGMMVDGVRLFDSNDAFSYSTANAQDASPMTAFSGDGIWNRDAWVNEGVTMDPANAHQQNTGRYHYHALPIALRYLLGDHVDFNAANKTYGESTVPVVKHSPILGWIQDGFPLYGPYGYSSASNAASGVRRMVSGFAARNGLNGTTNLATTGRHTLPAWAARTYNRSVTLAASQYGPAVTTTYPIGQYLEDYDYLGDLGVASGTNTYDLDEFNGRWCVTPEFPGGTYAYFTTMTSSNTPAYPYNMGRMYYGTNMGGLVTSITEAVVTNFSGGPDAALVLNKPTLAASVVTLVWSATEGGTYRVESSTNLSSWTTNGTGIAAITNRGSFSGASAESNRFFRVARTALATNDSVFGSGGILSVSPTSGTHGTTFTLTINLDPAVSPPPQAAPVNSVSVGASNGTSNTHVSQTKVTSSITLGSATGPQTVTVVFPGPPGNPTAIVTYTLANGFTVN